MKMTCSVSRVTNSSRQRKRKKLFVSHSESQHSLYEYTFIDDISLKLGPATYN